MVEDRFTTTGFNESVGEILLNIRKGPNILTDHMLGPLLDFGHNLVATVQLYRFILC